MQSLHRKLQELTKPFHTKIETNVFALKLKNKTLTMDDYIEWLQKMYFFHRPIEQTVAGFVEFAEYGVELSSRFRADAALCDLDRLGIAFDKNIKIDVRIPSVTSFTEALGVMYVLEGSTLGGKVIAGMLNELFSDCQPLPTDYFYSRGENLIPMWMTYVEALNRFDINGQDTDILINSACETYSKLNDWLNGYVAVGG